MLIERAGKERCLTTKPADNWPVVRAALGEAMRAGAWRIAGLVRPPLWRRMPTRLLFAPQDLRGTDAAVAAEMASGLYVFADRHPPAMPGGSPFEIEAPSPAWAEELYGFGWLRDLRAAGSEQATALARSLTLVALRSPRRVLDRGVARQPAVAARRVISMLAHSPLLLKDADHDFHRRYLRRIGRDAARLRRAMRDAREPSARLAAIVGFAYAGLACAGLEQLVWPTTRRLEAELERLVLAEDAPLARNASALAALLLDLLPLRLLYAGRSIEVPAGLDRTVERALRILATLRHGGGDLALFNGTGPTRPADLALLFSGGRDAEAEDSAPGYVRMAAEGTLVLADIGGTPPLGLSAGAHAGPLAFELSSGAHRIVVNAGAPPHPGPATEAARRTAAHSTLVLAGESAGCPIGRDAAGAGWAASSLSRRFGPVLVGGARDVGHSRQITEDALVLTAHHDGYRRLGAVHSRMLRLKLDGTELEGEDAIRFSGRSAAPEAGAVLHFHLHPDVQAREEEGGGGIVLDLPNGERWRFGAGDAVPRLEPSLFFAVTEGRRATRQIVLPLPPAQGEAGASVRWLFIRS